MYLNSFFINFCSKNIQKGFELGAPDFVQSADLLEIHVTDRSVLYKCT